MVRATLAALAAAVALYAHTAPIRLTPMSGFVSAVDTDKGEKLAEIRVETAKLEGVAVENSGGRVFVNDRSHSQVAVIDHKQRAVIGQWQITIAKLNLALALDEAGHRLYVECRSGQIDVFNTDTGKEVAIMPIGEGVDDLSFDPATKRIFAATGAGSGSVEAYRQRDADHYDLIRRMASDAEGKNGIYVAQVGRYFVGVPDHVPAPATILVFDVAKP